MDNRLNQAPIGVLELRRDGTITAINATGRDVLGLTEDPTGQRLHDVYPRSVEETLRQTIDADTIEPRQFEEYYPDIDGWLAVTTVPDDTGVLVYVEDVTARRAHEQTADQLRAERARTAVIDELIADVINELVGAQSRDAIMETICRELGETELYEFAWAGDRQPGSDDVAIRAVVGDTGETFAAVRDTTETNNQTLEERAIESGDLQVVQSLADSAHVPEPIRRAGFADGIQSLIAMPLGYGSDCHGVVGVYASRGAAFSDRERTSFETLGTIAGFAVTAARNRTLLHADLVTEVSFEVGDESVLASLSDRLDARLVVDGVVPQAEETLRCYVSVDGTPLDDIKATVSNTSGIAEPRVIHADDAGATLEFELQESALLLIAASFGATVQRAVYEHGAGEIHVELPPDGDLRRLAHAASRAVGADVTAKQQRNRSGVTARQFRAELTDRLTERQETVLRTAYLADYFESPRGSTAEEVAASLGITGSTLLHHLRASQRKLLAAVFDEETNALEPASDR